MASRANPQTFIKLFSRGFSSKLFVKGISFSSTDKALSEAFSKFGKVVEAKVIMTKEGTRSKGFGYVTFDTEEEAQKALTCMNGKLLDGRVIFVDNAWPRKRKPTHNQGANS